MAIRLDFKFFRMFVNGGQHTEGLPATVMTFIKVRLSEDVNIVSVE